MVDMEERNVSRKLPPKMAFVLSAVYTTDGEPRPVDSIRSYVWDRARISYDQTNHYLNRLIKAGLVERPKRGYYRQVQR